MHPFNRKFTMGKVAEETDSSKSRVLRVLTDVMNMRRICSKVVPKSSLVNSDYYVEVLRRLRA